MTLLCLITTSCATNKVQRKVYLKQRPEREELPEIRSVKDCAVALNYYEHLVQKWELWGNQTIETLQSAEIEIVEIP